MSLYIEPYYNELFPGSCFPKATGLVVVDPQGTEPVAVIIRNGIFIEPDGGWEKPERVFRVLVEDEQNCHTGSTPSSGINTD